MLGVLAAMIILVLAFGSVLAMGLPIGTALFGLGVGAGVLGIVSNAFGMPEFSPQIAAMIGLGVGIDYALFIVSRYRENFHAGMEPEEAVVHAVDTSGRAVMFAGITVIISLLGLFIIGLAFVRGLAVASALSVLVMMIACHHLAAGVDRHGRQAHRGNNSCRGDCRRRIRAAGDGRRVHRAQARCSVGSRLP